MRELPTRTVLFVGYSPKGELAKRVREVLARLAPILGFKVRGVERTGTPLKVMFPLGNLWEGVKCGREDCVFCTHGGETIPPCTKKNLLYENICVRCNPTARDKGEFKGPQSHHPSIYVGETSKSIFERTKQHWDAFKSGKEDSHILKHHQYHHGGEGEAEFHMKIVGFFTTALSRQVGEAVRIRRRGG